MNSAIWLPIEFHGFTSRINSKGYHSLVPGLISFFRDGMGPFKSNNPYLKLVGSTRVSIANNISHSQFNKTNLNLKLIFAL